MLRYINSLPFEATVRHYYPIKHTEAAAKLIDLTEAAAWDEMRVKEDHFLIPELRSAWQRMCETPIVHDSAVGDLPARAFCILDLMEKHGITRQLYSLGVGLAALEYHIKRLKPELKVFCSDYSAETVNRLRKIFHECDGIGLFDLVNDRFKSIFPKAEPQSLVLIHRVDPSLNDTQWKNAFTRMNEDGVSHILFVVHRLLTLRYALESKRREYWHRMRGLPLALSGYIRTRERLIRLWKETYEEIDHIVVGSSDGFLLRRI